MDRASCHMKMDFNSWSHIFLSEICQGQDLYGNKVPCRSSRAWEYSNDEIRTMISYFVIFSAASGVNRTNQRPQPPRHIKRKAQTCRSFLSWLILIYLSIRKEKSALLMVIAATTGGSDGFDVKKLGVKKEWAVSGWKNILSEERLFCGRAIFSSMRWWEIVSAPFSPSMRRWEIVGVPFSHLWEDEKPSCVGSISVLGRTQWANSSKSTSQSLYLWLYVNFPFWDGKSHCALIATHNVDFRD